jgi:hypothetical protein
MLCGRIVFATRESSSNPVLRILTTRDRPMRFRLDRRELLSGMAAATGAAAVFSIPPLAALATSGIHVGYAGITRAGNGRQAIEDMYAVALRGVQLRSNWVQEFRSAAKLRDLLVGTSPRSADAKAYRFVELGRGTRTRASRHPGSAQRVSPGEFPRMDHDRMGQCDRQNTYAVSNPRSSRASI